MINWGILGFGKMGFTFANAIRETSNSKLIGIASKSENTFQDFKNKSYDELISDKKIDAIYLSTLNNTHIDLIKKIIKTGKKILCEKPVSINFEELANIRKIILEKKIQFYEAIAYYSHQQTLDILNLINNNEIGDIESIESNFGFKAKFKPTSRLFNRSLGGGSIFDLGCYPISFIMLFTKNPEKLIITSKNLSYAKSGVDDEAIAHLSYDGIFNAKIHVSIKNNLKNTCVIKGSKGYIKITEPWSPGVTSAIEVTNNKHFYIKSINSKLSLYSNQIEKVSESFLDRSKKLNLFDIEKSLINMKLMSNWLGAKN